MKEQEIKVEEIQQLLFEVKALIKICTLALDSCITDEELQLQDHTEIYVLLRNSYFLLSNIEHIMDIKEIQKIAIDSNQKQQQV